MFFDKRLENYDNDVFKTKVVTKDGKKKILFSLNDFSTPYLHDYQNWFDLCTTGKYEAEDMCIAMEYQQVYGPLACLHFTRTRKIDGEIMITYPLSTLIGDFQFVPDLTDAFTHNFSANQSSLHHFLVPTHVINCLMSYTQRQTDEGYKYPELVVVASGLLRSLKIGSTVYADRWNVSVRDFNRITISLFILGAINRADRTSTISSAFQHLKKWQKNDGLCFEIRQILCGFFDKFPTFAEKRDTENSNRIWHFDIITPQDYSTSKTFKGNNQSLKAAITSNTPFVPPVIGGNNPASITTGLDYEDDDEDMYTYGIKFTLDRYVKAGMLPYHATCTEFTFENDMIDYLMMQELLNKYKRMENATSPKQRTASASSHTSVSTVDSDSEADALINEIDLVLDHINKKENDTVSTTVIFDQINKENSTASTTDTTSHSEYIPSEPLSEDIVDAPTTVTAPKSYSIRTPSQTSPQQPSETDAAKLSSAPINRPVLSFANLNLNNDANEQLETMTDNLVFGHDDLLAQLIGAGFTPAIDGTRDIDARVYNENTPRNFLPGHCIMQSFWRNLPETNRPAQRNVIRSVYHTLCVMYQAGAAERLINIQAYIHRGIWNNISADNVLFALATVYKVRICVMRKDPATDKWQLLTSYGTGKEIILFWNGQDHYSSTPNGGTKEKFNALLDHLDAKGKSILELSGAPGELAYIAATQYGALYNLAHYTKGLPLNTKHFLSDKKSQSNGINTYLIERGDKTNTAINVIPYDTYANLYRKVKNNKLESDIIICDAANAECSEHIIKAFVEGVHDILTPGVTFVVKHFIPMACITKLGLRFESVETIKVIEAPNSSERYTIMSFYNGDKIRKVADMNLEHNPLEEFLCHAIVPFDSKKIGSFIDYHFSEIKKEFKEHFAHLPRPKRLSIQFVAGYASAGKTTKIVEYANKHYDSVVFVAPSVILAQSHNIKFGVTSYTPHLIFDLKKKPDCIIVDEFSVMFVEFLALLHMKYPEARIIISGDVQQTPAVCYDKTKNFTTFASIGIENNLLDVFAVPQDIAEMLNRKLGLLMQTKSLVKRGLCVWKGKMEDLKDYQFVVFNSDSQKDLVAKGYKCATITTYQGSREPTIVFYIDDHAVRSQLLNRTEWIYTALTRGTHNLVLYGTEGYIEKYFNVHGTKIPSYSHYSELNVVTDVFNDFVDEDAQPDLIVADKIVPVAADHCPPAAAMQIAASVRLEGNPAYAQHAFLQPVEMPAVQSGQLKVNADLITTKHRSFRGSQICPNIPFVKNQVSSDTKETVRTLITRYSKQNRLLKGKKLAITTDKLLRGLSKAIYGNARSIDKLQKDLYHTHDELRKCYRDYLEALNKKMNKNQKCAHDIDRAFDEYDEIIEFVNKSQGKYSEADEWDTSDKCGQGVASFSKRVNLLLCAYARALMERIRHIAKKNKRNIIFATHGSDEEISAEITAMLEDKWRDDEKWFLNDFSEWDSSFINAMSGMTKQLCLWMGAPPFLMEWFTQYRTHWKIVFHTKLGNATLQGHGKQFSGNPFTLAENTLCNCALMNVLFDFKGHKASVFKGDDSSILCKEAVMTTEGKELLKVTNHKLKFNLTDIGEFAGFFITPYGFYPDLVRRTCKFLGATYRSKEHFEESKINVANSLKVVKTQYQVNHGALMNSLHYGQDRLTYGNALNLQAFLFTVPDIKWEQLVEVVKPVLTN
jgi:hypothetical protein